MTKKRKSQSDLQISESSKSSAIKSSSISNGHDAFENGASTSKQLFDPRKSYAYSIKDEPKKLKYLRRRTLVEAADLDDKNAFVSNWYTSVIENPSFHTLSTKYPTAKSLLGYSYHGEKEIDRLERFFDYSKRTEDEIEKQVQSHKQVQEDLIEADRIFNELSRDNPRLGSLGVIADKIGWRQIPSSLAARLHEDSINQAFETQQMTNSEIQRHVKHNCLDWIDNYDISNPPGKSILQDIEHPRFNVAEPPITCCIFTKHRNGQISRCLREPTRAFSLQISAKVVKKSFPFFWNSKVKVPAICAFHYSVIEKEPKNTEFNPFFERALGKHEKIEPVRFTEKSQFDQLGKYINGVLQAEKDEHTEAMSFDVRLLKLLEPPKNAQAIQEIRNRRLFDTEIVRNGKSTEELDECYERAMRRRNELRSAPSPNFDVSDDEVDEFELPTSTEDWLPKKSRGTSLPIYNSLIDNTHDLNEDERILYKASEFGLLDLNESSLVEASERYRTLLDINANDEDDNTLRIFGTKTGGIEGPKINFDTISAASIRRIKKFYNLPNRSGATSKTLLMEGLTEYFLNKPVDELAICKDFLGIMNDRQRSKGENRLYDKTAARKIRQAKKIQLGNDLKYLNETVAHSSATSSEIPLTNLTVINPNF